MLKQARFLQISKRIPRTSTCQRYSRDQILARAYFLFRHARLTIHAQCLHRMEMRIRNIAVLLQSYLTIRNVIGKQEVHLVSCIVTHEARVSGTCHCLVLQRKGGGSFLQLGETVFAYRNLSTTYIRPAKCLLTDTFDVKTDVL